MIMKIWICTLILRCCAFLVFASNCSLQWLGCLALNVAWRRCCYLIFCFWIRLLSLKWSSLHNLIILILHKICCYPKWHHRVWHSRNIYILTLNDSQFIASPWQAASKSQQVQETDNRKTVWSSSFYAAHIPFLTFFSVYLGSDMFRFCFYPMPHVDRLRLTFGLETGWPSWSILGSEAENPQKVSFLWCNGFLPCSLVISAGCNTGHGMCRWRLCRWYYPFPNGQGWKVYLLHYWWRMFQGLRVRILKAACCMLVSRLCIVGWLTYCAPHQVFVYLQPFLVVKPVSRRFRPPDSPQKWLLKFILLRLAHDQHRQPSNWRNCSFHS